MMEGLAVPVGDLALGIDMACNGRLRLRNILLDLFPSRVVLVHHRVDPCLVERLAVLHGQRPIVGFLSLRLTLGVEGGYTAALLKRRGLGPDALPLLPLPA